MSANRDREEEIFDTARELAAGERAVYLAERCGQDADLRQRIEGMLAADAAAGDFFKTHDAPSPTVIHADASLSPSIEKPGDRIGRYKLLQQIGEGGMGLVYMAEQDQPVRRSVALKIIKLGMDTRQVVARFEAERQALAMMNHPHIAKVFDAGATDSGRPYFVMELVRGIPITEYCDKNCLPTRQRLDLFILVCQAVQHAHQKGIIHRDLKPSNILVTLNDGVPWPMIIDFGIAKATHQRLTEKTLFTSFAQMIGTPAYMSPEQAEMSKLDVDTRSDIYALGVLLYELLTGNTPFSTRELLSLGYREMQRTIAEKEPPRLSTRLSTMANEERTVVAKNRSVDVSALAKLFRGDLDWIAMKCLEKDRARRYETANALAADIRRHLDCEPVVARPPSRLYEFQKTVRRHKFGFAAATALVLVLMLGVVVSTWQAVRATNAEKRSAAALDELRATAPAFAEQAQALAAREHFVEAIEKLDYALKLRPDALEFLAAKGDLLRCQLKLADAAAIYREALRVKPDLARAEAAAKLCDELLAAPANAEGQLTRENLAKLHLAMQQEQRPAAELMPVARLLGAEKSLLVEYWLARLKGLPITADKPLEKRLTVRDDGRLALDLSLTRINDLSPLADAPLAALDVSQCQELADLSPLRGIALIELKLSGTSVADLTPLREMHTLEKLNVKDTKVSDLAALSALRLKVFNFQGCPVSDLNPIRGMPLEEMALSGTRVADLSPLIGMPIKGIDLSMAPVLDFSPLTQLPLEKCILQRNRITDLTVLRDKPLKELVLWGCVDARNYAAIAGIQTLELLLLPSEYRDLPAEDRAAIGSLRNHPRLRQLGSEIMNQMGHTATGSKDVFWKDWDREQSLVTALQEQGVQFFLTKLPARTYRLSIHNQPLRDLNMLKEAPISELILSACPFSILTPIRDLKLEQLELSSDAVADLGPLHGMPLKKLFLNGPEISDLTPLTGLPLRDLYLDGCMNVTNVDALAEIRTLENVTVPLQTRNIEVLRQLPKLQRLGFGRDAGGLPASTVADFWKDGAPDGWLARLRDSGLKIKMLKRLPDGTWEVDLQGTSISDLSMLRGARISMLGLGETKVSDLTPLRGLPLKMLWLWSTRVTDLAPLQGMELNDLNLVGTKVADISVLRGMPLDSLRLNRCTELTDLSPLAGVSTLTKITLSPNAKNFEFLRASPKLERISFEEDPSNSYHPNKTAAEFWKEYDANSWISRLRGAGFKISTLQRQDDGTWEVNLHGSMISDLTILHGAPISSLTVGFTAVSDLSPLKGMPLVKLNVTDTDVTDISVLRGMPLTDLRLAGCKAITDLSPLADSKHLMNLSLPPNAKDFEFLRRFPKLERISFKENPEDSYNPDKTAAEFWKEYDAKKKWSHHPDATGKMINLSVHCLLLRRCGAFVHATPRTE